MEKNILSLGVSDSTITKWERYYADKEKKDKTFKNPFKGLNREQKIKYIYSKKRHSENKDMIDSIMFWVKSPYTFPRWFVRRGIGIVNKITYKGTREEQEKEIRRLKLVMQSKEKAREMMELMKFENYFKQINFKDKLGNYPRFIGLETDGEKETFTFKSYIPTNDWISKKETLENIFNTNIIDIQQGEDKQIAILETTKKNIPDFIPWSNEYLLEGLNINLGQTALNNIIVDLEAYTSGIISGSVGSGKSVTLIGILIQLLLKKQLLDIPIKFILFDGKGGLDLQDFEKFGQFTTEIEEFSDMLEDVWNEYQTRKNILRAAKCQKLSEYNSKKPDKRMEDIFIIIDELSVLTEVQGLKGVDKEIRQVITKKLADLARLGRALGIHILLGIQVPNHESCPGFLKNVLDLRISGFLFDESASKIILNNTLASKMEHVKGRMIKDVTKYQAYFFSLDLLKTIKTVKISEIENNKKTKTAKTIELSEKRKNTAKKDKDNTIEADIDLSNE